MDDEPLPNIAIIGGGPIGIEAALYARFLGYPVTLYESGGVCEHVRQWGHVQLFSPFGMNSSPLGLSALLAQFPEHQFPDAGALHTGTDWIEKYLQLLAESDLLKGCIRTKTRVESIGRETSGVSDPTSRSESPFRILVSDEKGEQRIEHADIVIDASGTWEQPNPLGAAGMPAVGEWSLFESIAEDPVDAIFTQQIVNPAQLEATTRRDFAVIGRGFSAATNIVQLGDLHNIDPSTRCVWITRNGGQPDGPMKRVEEDALQHRDELAAQANNLATSETAWLQWKAGTEIHSIRFENGKFELTLTNGESIAVDHVIANTGFHGDYEMLEALQIHRCYASGGPMAWAASLTGSSADCLQQVSTGPDALLTTEQNFYIIGSKSYGRDPRFLFATGLQQIRDIFKIVAERDTLDLYATMLPAPLKDHQ